MTLLLALGIGVSGGLGAVLRTLVDRAVRRRTPSRPLGIMVVNVSASLFAGFIAGLTAGAVHSTVDEGLVLALLVGFLGGYSTFSTVAVDTVELAREGRTAWVLMNTLGMLALSILATLLGFACSVAFR